MNKNIKEIAVVLDGTAPQPLEIVLDKPGETVRVIVLGIGRNSDAFNAPMKIIHRAPHTTSETTMKTVLMDGSIRQGDAVIVIEKGAAGSNARLEARTLLLSPNARATTKPVFEILENDVRASHAATTGALNPDELFYLQSRGVDPADARQMLTWGFIAAGLEKIQDTTVRAAAEKKLKASL